MLNSTSLNTLRPPVIYKRRGWLNLPSETLLPLPDIKLGPWLTGEESQSKHKVITTGGGIAHARLWEPKVKEFIGEYELCVSVKAGGTGSNAHLVLTKYAGRSGLQRNEDDRKQHEQGRADYKAACESADRRLAEAMSRRFG